VKVCVFIGVSLQPDRQYITGRDRKPGQINQPNRTTPCNHITRQV
jgi:hypothetical protein